MITVNGSPEWRAAHPGAVIGLLEMSGIDNSGSSPQLNQVKRSVEARLRQAYAGFERADFLKLPVMAAYQAYYRRFDKTYHVLLQVESLALKGKELPQVSPLVDANFATEVDTLVLAAGHDADRLVEPVWIDVVRPGEQFTPLHGQPRPILPGDMAMRDAHGLCCTILYGQDGQSPITPGTQHVLYVAYAPAGAAHAVQAHLEQVERCVRLFAPRAGLEQNRLLAA